MEKTTQEIELQNMPYDLYLKTKHWKAFRIKALKYHGRKCMMCGNSESKIFHVHHLTYKNRGCEKMDDVVVLCPDCHKAVHKADFDINPEPKQKIIKINRTKQNKKKRPKENPAKLLDWLRKSVSDEYIKKNKSKSDRYLNQHSIELQPPKPERPISKNNRPRERRRLRGGIIL